MRMYPLYPLGWLWVGLSVALVATFGAPSRVVAQAEPQSQPQSQPQSEGRARALFEAGRVAVGEGDYDSAYGYFSEAYELSRRPRLLFNMANSAERLRRDEEALAHYRHYLEELPDAENAVYVNSRIDSLLRGAAAAPEPEPEPEPGPEPESAPGPEAPIAAIATISAGAALAGVGGILLGVGASERATVDAAQVGSRWEDVRGSHEAANALGPAGGVLLGVGIATAIAGVVLLGVGEEDQDVSVIPTPNGLLLRGRF